MFSLRKLSSLDYVTQIKNPYLHFSYHSKGWHDALSALWCVGASSGTVEGLLVTMDLGLGGTTLGLGGTTAQLPRSAEV